VIVATGEQNHLYSILCYPLGR